MLAKLARMWRGGVIDGSELVHLLHDYYFAFFKKSNLPYDHKRISRCANCAYRCITNDYLELQAPSPKSFRDMVDS